MEFQTILVCAALIAALFYLGRMLYFAVKPGKKNKSCGGCGGCADLSQIDVAKSK